MPVLPTGGHPFGSAQLSRRGFIGAGIAGGLALAGCGHSQTTQTGETAMADAIAAAERARPHTGRTVTASLTPQQAQIDLGGPVVQTLAFGNTVPGPLIRASVGDEVVVAVSNRLDRATSVHWHGIALRNDMDGAEPATPNIGADQDFTYRFSVPNAGTYWAHPHVGLEDDHGLYLPFIVDDPTEPNRYDAEWIVVLDDWTDGVGKSPQQLFDALVDPNKPRMQELPGSSTAPSTSTSTTTTTTTPTTKTSTTTTTTGTSKTSPTTTTSTTGKPDEESGEVGSSDLLGGDAGDIAYPYYLVNGRIPAAPTSFKAKPGQRIRIRIINVASDTAFRVALAGHTMTVTHTDGYPVIPTQVDALLIGMAERYDVIVTAADGVFPLVASAEGKNALARALLSTGSGTAPDPQFRPAELNKRVGTVEMFTATTAVNLGRPDPQMSLPITLGGTMAKYDWTINGEPYSKTHPLTVRLGERPTLMFDNPTMMYHPIHLHGHTFQMIKPDGTPGARKDTVIVLPGQQLRAVLVADNPGYWVLHCHNSYHREAGMMTLLDYIF
ncbi:multicopper oxidase family protein [Mycobacterium marinum]|uniref:multicopper oxidase family protein n=1 Tax=Mycobacterium marinum TaxID=1781 RepID=UPI0003589B68|nr:multicopper oxidase family protein [Mycobacterium marinum]EPQ78466.1 Multicopper oxidase [Mycobacterium marinum MB2]GJO15060.1 multicopper oxidase MmcO [Mycobacterium marinum]GJP27524.1 multicopper oxidase MmcO [Mycobacterium marinum]